MLAHNLKHPLTWLRYWFLVKLANDDTVIINAVFPEGAEFLNSSMRYSHKRYIVLECVSGTETIQTI